MQAAGRFPLSSLYRNNKLISDYLAGNEQTLALAAFNPDAGGIEQAISSRTQSTEAREWLSKGLREQYRQLGLEEYISAKADLLKLHNTYTVTAAHQPNLMTGPCQNVS